MTIEDIVISYGAKLFNIAYRMTGEIAVSEDIVQESFLHWSTLPQQHVHHPKAFLCKMVTNRCLNHLSATKRQRDAYRGAWLPEPIISQVYSQVEAAVDVSYGLMILLQKLSPAERAVFLLKESFHIEYEELSEALNFSQAGTRQLYHRAKAKLKAVTTRFPHNEVQHHHLLTTFVSACKTGNIDNLIALLQEDIILYSDGGGKVPAALNPLMGKKQVSVFLKGLIQKYAPLFNFQFTVVNEGPGLILIDKITHKLNSIITFDLTQAGLKGIYIIRNPDKLTNIKIDQCTS